MAKKKPTTYALIHLCICMHMTNESYANDNINGSVIIRSSSAAETTYADGAKMMMTK